MTAKLLDGKALAGRIEDSLRAEVETFSRLEGRAPRLVVVLVGEMAASASYVRGKAAAAAEAEVEGCTRLDERFLSQDIKHVLRL